MRKTNPHYSLKSHLCSCVPITLPAFVTSGAAAAVPQTKTIATNAKVSARIIAMVLSRLLFFAKFLEAGIVPKRIEHRIGPE